MWCCVPFWKKSKKVKSEENLVNFDEVDNKPVARHLHDPSESTLVKHESSKDASCDVQVAEDPEECDDDEETDEWEALFSSHSSTSFDVSQESSTNQSLISSRDESKSNVSIQVSIDESAMDFEESASKSQRGCSKNFCPSKKPCDLCKHYLHSIEDLSTPDGKTLPIKEQLSCMTENVVYVLACVKCDLRYVGSTTNSTRRRFETHKKDIRNGLRAGIPSTASGIAKHFSSAVHRDDWTNPKEPKGPIPHLRVSIVAKSEDSNLKNLEDVFITQLRTLEVGLNKQNCVKKQIGLGEAKTGQVANKSLSGRPKSVLQPQHRQMLSDEEVKQLEGLLEKCQIGQVI